jgi:hypothetical protein
VGIDYRRQLTQADERITVRCAVASFGTASVRTIERAADLHDLLIERRSQAAVEPQLFLAVVAPQGERREIDEPEVDRFFDLIGVAAGEHDP